LAKSTTAPKDGLVANIEVGVGLAKRL